MTSSAVDTPVHAVQGLLHVRPPELAKLDRSIAARKTEIERSLQQGPGELRQVAHQVTLRRQALFPQLEAAVRALAQAQVDLKAV